MADDEKFDAVVVGAGPAGTAAALTKMVRVKYEGSQLGRTDSLRV